MRILLNTRPLVSSRKTGIGYYVSNLYRELVASGIEVFPTIDVKSQGVLNLLRRTSSCVEKKLGNWFPSSLGHMGHDLVCYLSGRGASSLDYDLYHEPSLESMPEIKSRSVCNLYDLAFEIHPELLSSNLASFWRTNVEKNARTAKRVIVNTHYIKEEAADLLKLDKDKIDVIPLAPSRIFQHRDRDMPKPDRSRRFTARDYILYVGTVEPRKGLKTLIRAYREIKEKYDLSLVIAGGLGWLYDDILSYPEELGIKGDVIFTKYIDESLLSDLYRYASVFVYPSLYEGFGLPPLEAMACGTPVVISDIPTLREVAGDAAILFQPKDHDGLAHVLEKVLSSESLRMELRSKGLRRSAEYSWEKVARETIQTYQKALKD